MIGNECETTHVATAFEHDWMNVGACDQLLSGGQSGRTRPDDDGCFAGHEVWDRKSVGFYNVDESAHGTRLPGSPGMRENTHMLEREASSGTGSSRKTIT